MIAASGFPTCVVRRVNGGSGVEFHNSSQRLFIDNERESGRF